VPVEGQWERSRAPLSRRDKRLLGALGLVAAVAATATGGVYLARSDSSPRRACLVVNVPSTMGGAQLRQCGASAHTFCREQGPRDRSIAAACRRQGYGADLAAG
jgi:hypothetical protein